jgi:hypothetical protein
MRSPIESPSSYQRFRKRQTKQAGDAAPLDQATEKKLVWVDAVQIGLLKKHALDNRLAITRVDKQIAYLKQICEQIIVSLKEEVADVARSHHLTGGEMQSQLQAIRQHTASVEEHLQTNVVCKEEIAKQLQEEVSEKNAVNKSLRESVAELESSTAQFEMDLMNQLSMLNKEHQSTEERKLTEMKEKRNRIATLESELSRMQHQYLTSGLVLDQNHLTRLISRELSTSYVDVSSPSSSQDEDGHHLQLLEEQSPRKGSLEANNNCGHEWSHMYFQLTETKRILSLLPELSEYVDVVSCEAQKRLLAKIPLASSSKYSVTNVTAAAASSSSPFQSPTLASHGDILTSLMQSLRLDSELHELALQAWHEDTHGTIKQMRQYASRGWMVTVNDHQDNIIKIAKGTTDRHGNNKAPYQPSTSVQNGNTETKKPTIAAFATHNHRANAHVHALDLTAKQRCYMGSPSRSPSRGRRWNTVPLKINMEEEELDAICGSAANKRKQQELQQDEWSRAVVVQTSVMGGAHFDIKTRGCSSTTSVISHVEKPSTEDTGAEIAQGENG